MKDDHNVVKKELHVTGYPNEKHAEEEDRVNNQR